MSDLEFQFWVRFFGYGVALAVSILVIVGIYQLSSIKRYLRELVEMQRKQYAAETPPKTVEPSPYRRICDPL